MKSWGLGGEYVPKVTLADVCTISSCRASSSPRPRALLHELVSTCSGLVPAPPSTDAHVRKYL
jgi:hypothetical protein